MKVIVSVNDHVDVPTVRVSTIVDFHGVPTGSVVNTVPNFVITVLDLNDVNVPV